MAALNLNDVSFQMFLSKPITSVTTNLSLASVLTVLDSYERFKRKSNPRYSLSAEKYNIQLIESLFGILLMPLLITDEFWVHFQMFLLLKGVKGSTIGKYCGEIVTAMNWGTRHLMPASATYDIYDRKLCRYEKSKVALTPDDVSLIAHFDIDNLPIRKDYKRALTLVRDLFVLLCNLGLRYSDIRRINPSCFSDDKNIYTCVQLKTGNKAVVDIKRASFDKNVTHEILRRYNYYAPYPHDISNFNKHLHALLQLIGGRFNELIKTENKVRGEVITEEIPKWKAIASHTARRSFASYNVMRGIKEALIRRWTGHKDSKSFIKYIIFGDDEA